MHDKQRYRNEIRRRNNVRTQYKKRWRFKNGKCYKKLYSDKNVRWT